MTQSEAQVRGRWRYSINYGPEGEADYAFVYDADGALVSNLKTHHAVAVVDAMNAALASVKASPRPDVLAEAMKVMRAVVSALDGRVHSNPALAAIGAARDFIAKHGGHDA